MGRQAQWRSRTAAAVVVAWVAGLTVAVAGGAVAGPAPGATTLVSESFTAATLTSPSWVLPATASGTNTACLADPAASGTATPIPGCGSGAGGQAGLQLTAATNSEQGGVVYGLSVPTSDGLDATFDTYQWGGGGADGIGFFLAATNPADPQPPTIGPPGGPLGYAPNTIAGQTDGNGVSDGYLGFGLDAYGNYDTTGYDGTGCAGDASSANGSADELAVRGPGDATTGYCVLAGTAAPGATALAGRLDSGASPVAVPVEVALNPSATAVTTASGLTVGPDSWAVAVTPLGGTPAAVTGCPAGAQCLTGVLPAVPAGTIPASWLDAAGVPDQLSFGWTGSTGGVNDFHTVSDAVVSTLTGAPPTYTATLADKAGGTAAAGQVLSYGATVALSGTAEADPVTVTDTLPSGVTPDASADTLRATTGTGTATCAPASGSEEACTYTPPPGGLPPGAGLDATFGATVSAGPGGPGSLTDTVTVSSGDAVAATAADTISVGSPSVSASLTTASPDVAGVETVSPSAVPASSLDGSTGAGSGTAASAPLASIPLASIGLASSPLASIPLASIPLASIAAPGPAGGAPGLAAAAHALAATLLSDLSVTYPAGCDSGAAAPACTGWEGVLAGTPYENVPLEGVTLADVLDNPGAAARLDSVDLAALDLSSSPLASIPLASIELGSTPLSSIGLDASAPGGAALAAWCAELATVASSCQAFGITPGATTTGVTLLSLDLAGVPLASIPLASIPLASITLSSSPLASIPLASINLAANPLASIPLASIPLASIPLASIPLASIGDLAQVVDCSADPTLCASGGATLGQAAAAGVLAATATVGELGTYGTTTVGQLLGGDTTTAAGYPALTLGDLIVSTVPPTSYQWQSVDLADLPLAADETAGGSAAYTATLQVSTAPATVAVTVALPPTFAYVPGSATLDGVAEADPSGATTLAWTLPDLAVGPHTLRFAADAGIGLGPATATLTAAVDGPAPPEGPVPTVGPTAQASATVEVVDGEAPGINAPATAFPLSAGTLDTATPTQGALNLGYLSSAGDVNDWSVTVPQGAELSLALTNLPATYDLELFGPDGAQLQGAPTQDLPGVTDTLPSTTPGATTEATPGSGDIPVTPPPGDQLEAVSTNPSAQSQYIQTTPLAAGVYTVQVSGYDGAYATAPYLLQANLLGGATAPSCPGGIGYLPSLASVPAATGPVDVPAGTNTLFLVDTQRLSAEYGAPAEAATMAELSTVANDGAAGVAGAVVPVDAYPSVQAAYATWNTNPCSVPAANAVVAAISAVVDQIRADDPSVVNLVVVGADDQIPFARVADGATTSNERDYGAATFAGDDNVEGDALSLGYYFSDDPFAADAPLGVGSATLYLPQLAVGRLVETPAQIDAALARFVASDGDLDATAGLTTGYSFLTSGAQAVSANLAADGLSASSLINESWQEGTLDTALAAGAGVDSLNAHFDYSRALPAYDNANNVETNLFTTADVRNPPVATSYAGRLLFSMGCHAGLDIDDAEVATGPTAAPVDDWAKTFADAGALWVANTGYGYADTDTVAYSAKLMADFAAGLNGTLSVGEALTAADQQYAAGDAILSPYDLKALMEATLYGLPMYRLNAAGAPPTPPAGPATVTDAATGLTAAPVSVSLTRGAAPGQLGLVTTANGSYYQVNGTTPTGAGTQTTEFRPIEPLVSVPVTEPGLVAHGALIDALSSTDVGSFTPAYSLPAVGAADATPPVIGDAAFPGTLARVATYGTFTATGTAAATQLDLVAGQFLPNPAAPGTGTQRLFDSIGGEVLYDPPGAALAGDFTPPTIDSSSATTSPGGTALTVSVTPSGGSDPVVEVLVLSTDATSPGTWTTSSLTAGPAGTWTGSAPATPSGTVQYLVEAVDAAGNVAVSNNEGADFTGSPAAPVSITLTGPSADGLYTGPVTATVVAPAASTYVLDGSAPTAVPSGGVTVTATGSHTLTVTDPYGDTATQSFTISATQSTVSLSSPTDPVVVGQPVSYDAAVAPATPGAGSPGGAVEFLDAGVPVAACGGSAGVPIVAGAAACAVTYTTPGTHPLTADYLGDATFAPSATAAAVVETVDQAGATVGLTSSADPAVAGQSVTLHATVAVAAPGAATPTGFVEFLVGPVPVAACGGSAGVPIAAGAASCTLSSPTATAVRVSAVYLGDTDVHGPAASAPLTETFGRSATTTVLQATTATPSVGQADPLTATVAPVAPGAGAPTGSVEFLDGSTPLPACGGAGGEPLGPAGTASCTPSFATAGPHPISAAYLDDANFAGSTSPAPLNLSVGRASSGVALRSSADPSVAGQSVTFTATVTAPGSPTGTVEFLAGGTPLTACGGTGGAPLGAGGTATCTVAFAAAGATTTITAVYSGDANTSGSATATPLAQTVGRAATVTALSVSADPAVTGQSVQLGASVAVSAPGTGAPTGRVEFLAAGTPLAACGGAVGTPLGPTGTATCTLAFPATGATTLTAAYLGDPNFAGSPSAGVPETVGRAATRTALASSADPSAVAAPVVFTATVTVTAPGAGSPTGRVEFLAGGTPVAVCGAAAGAPIGAGGQATCALAFAVTGATAVTAVYLGDANFAGSGAGPLSQVVDSATTTTLAVSPDPVAVGRSVTLAATVAVTGLGSGTPAGSVTFTVGSAPVPGCGGGAGEPLGRTATATCTATFPTAGAETVVATYLGGPADLPSASGPGTEIVAPQPCPTLAGCDLAGLNLAGAGLSGANLTLTDLAGANLTGATLTGATLLGTDLAGANLTGANLSGAAVVAANLTGADLAGANLTGTGLLLSELAGANLTGATLAGASMVAVDLHGADLASVAATGLNAPGADLAGADLAGAVLTRADLSGANLTRANATGANFSGANLSFANLTGATTTGAVFTGANLTGTVF